ncbi:hypothetical protein [Streptomyces sp. YIM S03343]
MVRRTVPTAAVTLGVAALLSAAMTTASAAPAAPPTRTATVAPATTAASTAAQAVVPRQVNRPVLVDCFSHPRVRPHNFILACGDGNSVLAKMRWAFWGTNSALGRGLNWVNDCKPFCAAGTFHAYRVIVRLDRAEPWKQHPRLEQFTRMRLFYPDGRPQGYQPVMTLRLWN